MPWHFMYRKDSSRKTVKLNKGTGFSGRHEADTAVHFRGSIFLAETFPPSGVTSLFSIYQPFGGMITVHAPTRLNSTSKPVNGCACSCSFSQQAHCNIPLGQFFLALKSPIEADPVWTKTAPLSCTYVLQHVAESTNPSSAGAHDPKFYKTRLSVFTEYHAYQHLTPLLCVLSATCLGEKTCPRLSSGRVFIKQNV